MEPPYRLFYLLGLTPWDSERRASAAWAPRGASQEELEHCFSRDWKLASTTRDGQTKLPRGSATRGPLGTGSSAARDGRLDQVAQGGPGLI